MSESRQGRYTKSMKTAISVPDDVFEAAERQARRMRMTRSQLYSEALSEYLARHGSDEVTDAMNDVVDRLQGLSGEFVAAATRRVLEKTEW